VRRFDGTRSGMVRDVDRQRAAGCSLIVRLDDRYRRYALRQELARGAVVVMMIGGVMVRGRRGHVGRRMLGVASMMLPAECNMLGRGLMLVIMQQPTGRGGCEISRQGDDCQQRMLAWTVHFRRAKREI
jgi:hypothetical protein